MISAVKDDLNYNEKKNKTEKFEQWHCKIPVDKETWIQMHSNKREGSVSQHNFSCQKG